MFSKFTAVISRLMICCVVFFNAETALSAKNITKFTLENGLQVIVVENHIAPVITQMIWYKVGSSKDPEGKNGLAHLLEHMMFKGTKDIAPGEFSKIVANIGGNDNAFTTRDYTVYHQTVPAEKLELVMKLESDRMKNLLFIEEIFLNEKDVVSEERNMRVNNSPKNYLHEKMLEALFIGHPYSFPVLGTEETLKSITQGDAYAFYEKYYNPNNAVLIIGGDVTVDQVKAMAEKHYGSIRNINNDYSKIDNSFDLNPIKKDIVHRDEKIKQRQFSKYYLAPNHKTKHSELTYPSIVLSHLLGSGEASRLYRALVRKHASATHVSTYYNDISEGPSILYLNLYPSQGISLDTLQEHLDAEIKNIIEKGFTKDEIDRAKSELIASAIYARDGIFPLTQIVGESATFDIGENYIDEWETNINDVTSKEIIKAAELIFKEMPSIKGILLPDNQ